MEASERSEDRETPSDVLTAAKGMSRGKKWLLAVVAIGLFAFVPWGMPVYRDLSAPEDYDMFSPAPLTAPAQGGSGLELVVPERSGAWLWYDRPAPVGGRAGGFLPPGVPYRFAGSWTRGAEAYRLPEGSSQPWAYPVPGYRWLAVVLEEVGTERLAWLHASESWVGGGSGLGQEGSGPLLEAPAREGNAPYFPGPPVTKRYESVPVQPETALYGRLDAGVLEAPHNRFQAEASARVGVIGQLRAAGRWWLLVEHSQQLVWMERPGVSERAFRGWGPLLNLVFERPGKRFRSCLPVVLFPPPVWRRCEAEAESGRLADPFERGYDLLDPVFARFSEGGS